MARLNRKEIDMSLIKKSLLGAASLLLFTSLVGCGNEESAHTHNFKAPTYSWSSDYKTCTATRVCADDASHKEEETVTSIYEVVSEASCEKDGSGKYTATFTNKAFTVQVHETTIAHEDHAWDEGEMTRFPTIYDFGEMTYHCSKCGGTKTEQIAKVNDATNYTLDAMKMEGLTGVYSAKAEIGADKASATIGIPLLAKQNLVNYPAYDSPGIIQGAAVDYEKKTGAVSYEWLEGQSADTLVAPYTYFRYTITKVTQKDADGVERTYDKLSGFDGTYYIIRVDVSNLIGTKESGYLHVKQESNKALMVQMGLQNGINTNVPVTLDAEGKPTVTPTIKDGYWWVGETKTVETAKDHNSSLYYQGTTNEGTFWFVGGIGFADGMGMKAMSYSIADQAAMLKDKNGNYKETPYIDVIVLSSGKLAAGADKGKEGAPASDITLSFYVDDTLDYNPSLAYDPTSQDTNHVANVTKKFFDPDKMTSSNNASSYIVKGDDLEIDVVTTETKKEQDVNEYWSLNKAIDFQDYNEHTIKLLCEVPVLEGLNVHSINEEYRKIVLDVNSFDIQIANHSQLGTAGLIVSNNASLEILDNSNTVGAELAVGNNANMEIQNGGTLIVDKTCQLEVEFDAASKIKYTLEKVVEMIEKLPKLEEAKDSDKETVRTANDAYNMLDEADKAKVSEENKTKLAELVEHFQIVPDTTPLNNGEITVKNGGKLVNEGIINIEGLEIKPQAGNPQETGQEVVRDTKVASLTVEEGGIIDNYGCLSIKGDLFLLGTLNNYGVYDDIIVGNDPDKGKVNHHKGIQVTWKDDVTKEAPDSTPENKKYVVNEELMTRPGILHVGKDASGNINRNAKVNNYGDIVLCPGVLEVYGSYTNIKDAEHNGRLYVCAVSEAVVPVTPVNPTDPLEERRQFTPPYESTITVDQDATYEVNGNLIKATIEIVGNGLFGKLTPNPINE